MQFCIMKSKNGFFWKWDEQFICFENQLNYYFIKLSIGNICFEFILLFVKILIISESPYSSSLKQITISSSLIIDRDVFGIPKKKKLF